MSVSVVLGIVLCTAVLHAGWNALAKSVGDRWVSSALIGLVNGVAGWIGVAVFGVPAGASWPWLVVSAVVQTGYLVLLTRAYAAGDMSRLYPVARGTSPVVVTVVSVAVLGERLPLWAWVGLAVLVGGIALLAFARGLPRRHTGMGLAVLVGLTIATYTLCDGVGVRHSGDPLAYISWLFALQGPLVVALALWRGGPGVARRMRTHAGRGLIGGAMSVVSYGIVVWAQNHAPIALVSGMRETSVVWAVLIGRLFLGERLVRREYLAIGLAALGALALQVAS